MPFADPARARESARQRYAKHKDDPEWVAARRERARASYRRNREKYLPGKREERRRALYGLTDAEFRALCADANGRCAICTRPSSRLVIDHDHSSGAVRELLCAGCNSGLGYIEREGWLTQALTYLEKHRA